ncbi:UNVERIFIED_CONTAM: GATA transcription factor 8 [Sesamum latifolium]|uniref:GATA transcription factor n=1 Tax=Sesamum latifolium TaxID=2727402 RepID=A0AAW2XIX6_9LAMI
MGPNFMDEIDCGNFFDQIDDLIEFPPENETGGGGGNLVGSVDSKDFSSMWNDALPESDPFFSGSHGNSSSDLSAELSVPYEDIVQLEWLSTFMEDSFSGQGMTLGKENLCPDKEPSDNQFQMSSPISVLESSSSSSTSSCSAEAKVMPLSPSHRGPQRARSKRPRPATFNPRAAMQLISPTSSFVETPQPFVAPGLSSESENFAESPTMKKFPKPAGLEPKKKKKIKIALPVDAEDAHQNPAAAPQAVRKCMHCEITKTPQWRAGPMGPKTLCNACGVRYKSGRLFPEYRPAASPTFIPSLHSNSHKKVLEMRGKVGPGTTATTPTTKKPELVPNM